MEKVFGFVVNRNRLRHGVDDVSCQDDNREQLQGAGNLGILLRVHFVWLDGSEVPGKRGLGERTGRTCRDGPRVKRRRSRGDGHARESPLPSTVRLWVHQTGAGGAVARGTLRMPSEFRSNRAASRARRAAS